MAGYDNGAASDAARGKPITKPFTEVEQQRFRNLLELANSSPYQGERDNAIAAAERLAKRHGMTLEEAASGRTQAPPREFVERSPGVSPMRDLSRVVHLMDYQIQLDKARIAEAIEQAKSRGLQIDQPKKARPRAVREWRTTWSKRRMEPHQHARVLIRETSLPVEEIASITGLDVYKVAEEKLKLRDPGPKSRKAG